ncbi:glycosyltransferase [Ningiella sp. W23]|uniref:glycosyltransferase n=1 Tax=Ningiella sp. W23 TaxID=3023715 RepID=UPI00375663ED
MSKKVSFIIPHMGREELLADTLLSISRQSCDLTQLEVIIVTKNPSLAPDTIKPETNNEEAENREGSPLSIRVFQAPLDKTISFQRNFGVQQSSGEYLAFLDADIYLSPNWVNAMLTLLEQHDDFRLVSAVQKASERPSPLEMLRTALSNAHINCNVEFLPGRNLLLSRHTFNQSGGFPESLETCEDYVFTQRVAALGHLYYSSVADYIHLGEDKKLWPMAKKEVWRGLSNIDSLKGRKIPISEWPSFIVPPAFCLSFILAIVCSVFGLIDLAIVCLLVFFSILLAYGIRLRRITYGNPSLRYIFAFYLLYFPARTIGTIRGALRSRT